MERQASPERIVVMIRSVLAAEGECLGCEDCFELLDHCAELVEAGESIAGLYPEVERHLKDCICCGAEFDALLSALRAAAQPAEA